MYSPDLKQTQLPRKTLFTRFLDTVEWLGNLLPHPITLFALFCVAILISSGIAGYFGVSVIDPRPEGAAIAQLMVLFMSSVYSMPKVYS